MSMTILYEVHDNLYVNLTNQCSCACTFCLRQTRDHMENSGVLWLDREPTAEEVKQEFAKFDMNKYKEVVFCGFGEPTMRLDVLLEVAEFVKKMYDKAHPYQYERSGGPCLWRAGGSPSEGTDRYGVHQSEHTE